MAQTIYINMGARSLGSALVQDEVNVSPVAFPDVVLGDQKSFQINLVAGDGANFAPESTSNSYSLKMAVGLAGLGPNSGTFTLTFGANTTAALNYDSTALQVQTALNAIASIISAGGVIVSGDAAGPWEVTFNTAGARAVMTGEPANLYPPSTTVISTAQEGSASPAVREIQIVSLNRRIAAFQDTFVITGNGRLGTINYATQGIKDLLGTENSVAAIVEFELTDLSANRTTICRQSCTVLREVIDPDALVPTPTSDYLTAAEVLAMFNAVHAYYSDTITGAGTGTITIGPNCKWLTSRYTVNAGGAPYTNATSLDSADRVAGDKAEFVFSMPASTNPVIQIKDLDSATVIWTETGSGAAYTEKRFFTWNGTSWESDQG